MREALQQIATYIEWNCQEDMTLDALAAHIGYSKFYLNHMFQIYTGYGLMAFVRRKKLEYALEAIREGARVLDAAILIGYSSERAFSRAVSNEFGQSPSYFKAHGIPKLRPLMIYDTELNATDDRILSGFPASFATVTEKIREKGVQTMKQYLSDVRYERFEDMKVVSATLYGNEPEDAVIALMNRLAAQFNLPVLRQFGFDSPVEHTEDVMTYRGYEYWLSVDEEALALLPSAESFDFEGTTITIKTIPGYRYATLRIEDPMSDPFERIGTGWRYLSSWLEDNFMKEDNFVPCSEVNCLEEVKEVGGVMVMDLYIPVDLTR